MTEVSCSDLRQNLSRYLDEAVESRAPIVVTRQNGRAHVLVLAEAEYIGWQDTVHLRSSPHNAERLLRGPREAEVAGLMSHHLMPVSTIGACESPISALTDAMIICTGAVAMTWSMVG